MIIKITSEHPDVHAAYRESFVAVDPAEAFAAIPVVAGYCTHLNGRPYVALLRETIEAVVAAGGTIYMARVSHGHWPGTFMARSEVEGEFRCPCGRGLARPGSHAAYLATVKTTASCPTVASTNTLLELTAEEECCGCRYFRKEVAAAEGLEGAELVFKCQFQSYKMEGHHLHPLGQALWARVKTAAQAIAERRHGEVRARISACSTCGKPSVAVLCQSVSPDYGYCADHLPARFRAKQGGPNYNASAPVWWGDGDRVGLSPIEAYLENDRRFWQGLPLSELASIGLRKKEKATA